MANYPSSLIVIDSQVDECWRLVDELGRHGSLRVIRADEDGVAAITEALSQHPTVDTLMVVAHGAPGQIHLGRTSLDLDSLDRYRKVLGQWFEGSTTAPQIHLYGCQVAAGDAGSEFLAKLHALTGAGIAASPRLVGHADLGGDWRLDVTLGQAMPQTWVSDGLAASYRAVLASANDNFENATVWDPNNSTTHFGDTTGATHQTGEPIHDPNLSTQSQATRELYNDSIWWKWTATSNGLITVDTIGSALSDTVLAVYTGGAVNSLSQVAFSDNISSTNLQSRVTFNAVANTTYYFAVDGAGTRAGGVKLNLNAAPQITSNQTFSVLESALNGASVGTVLANEPTGLTWSISSGNPDNDNDGSLAFAINATTGEITVNDAGDLDFESFATSYNLLVRATDAGSLSDEKLVGVSILNANDTPVITSLTTSQSTINEGSQVSLSGSFRDLDANDRQTVTIDWGDNTDDAVISSDNLVRDANGNLTFTNLLHTYGDNATYTITMTVRDLAVATATRTTSVVVNNVSPTITQGATLAQTTTEGSPTNFTLNATDPGRSDILTWAILNAPSNGTASISSTPTGTSQIISYTPGANFSGTDTFEVQVSDGEGFDTILVTMTVAPQPDPPTGLNIVGDVTTLEEGGTFTLTGTFSDPDAGDTFSVTINWGDNTTATVLPNSSITNLGNGNYRFTATHTYQADSGGTGTAFSINATVRDGANLTVSDTLSLPVTNVAPTITQGTILALTTNEDTPLTFNLSATDPADTNFQWSLVGGQPTGGTVAFTTNPSGAANQTLTFTPTLNFDQPSSFDVQVSDGNGGISTIQVLVDVLPVNDAPTTLTLTPDDTTLDEGGILTLNGSFVDVDSGDSHTVTIAWGDGNSTVLTDADLTISGTTYSLPTTTPVTHTYADEGNYTITVTVEDADGATVSRTQAVTVANVAPTITEGAILALTGTEDTPITFSLNGTDPGVDDELQWSIATAPGKGTVTILPAVEGQPQEFLYTPNDNAFGTDTFTVRLSDGDGGTDTIVVNVNLASVNDRPQITANQFTVNEGQPLPITVANLNATDVETFPPELGIAITGLTANERFEVAGVTTTTFKLRDVIEGRVTFFDDGDETAPAFSITVTDANLESTTVLGNVTLNRTNDAPEIDLTKNGFLVTQGGTTSLSSSNFSATDEESDDATLLYSFSRVEGGVLQVNGVTRTSFTQGDINLGLVRFVHDGSETKPILEYTVSDGLLSTSSTAMVDFKNVNDPPELSVNRLILSEGGLVPITLQDIDATDPDNDDNLLRFTVTNLDSNRTSPTYEGNFQLQLNPGQWVDTLTFTRGDIVNGNVRFEHSGKEVAPTYTITVSDNVPAPDGPLTDSSEAAVEFRTVNDVPIFKFNVLSIAEGETLVLSNTEILTEDEETPATGLTYTVSGLSGGRFEFVPATPGATPVVTTRFTQDDINNRRVQFVHDGGELRPAYTLTVTDGVNEVDSQVDVVLFTNINDSPVLVNNRLVITEGAPYTLTTNDINASDAETNSNSLIFTVGQIDGTGAFVATSTVAGGRFELRNSSGDFVATGSFTRNDIINQRVRFVHDGTETKPSYAIQVEDLNSPDRAKVFSQANVTFNAVNDLPVVNPNRLIVEQGGVFVFNSDPANRDLVATDEETTDKTKIVYTLTAVSAGKFEFVPASGSPSVIAVNGTFTQAQLDAGEIRFVHDGSEATPSYTVRVSDGVNQVTSNGNVTFKNINDAPRFTANSFSLTEGGTLVLTTANINATDLETVNSALKFTINSVTGGRFERVSTGLTVTEFTLADIISRDIQFTQPPADEETVPTYTISVTDTDLANPPVPANANTVTQDGTINFTPVNDAPTLVTNTLTIIEGRTVFFGDGSGTTLTGGVLKATDPETPAGQLVYTVSNVVGGQFEFTDPLLVGQEQTTFTQAQVTANQVVFVQDGTSVTPNYTVTVKDPQGLTATGTPTVKFTDVNDAPSITRNLLTIAEGATVVLGTANLQFSDEESQNLPGDVIYNVTDESGAAATPQGGQFELVSNPSAPGTLDPTKAITSFTQAQVIAGAVRFVHDGTETVPLYYLTLTDGGSVTGAAITTAPNKVTVIFERENDAPKITANSLTITEEGTVTINSVASNGDTLTLTAEDEETPLANLTYVVDPTSVTNGQFEFSTNAGVPIFSFTQAQITAGEVKFVHDPDSGEKPPTYTLQVRDGEGLLSAPSSGTITAFKPINDNPIFLINAISLTEGDVVTLTTDNLLARDEEDGSANLIYTFVGTVEGGKFVRTTDSDPTAAITSFTQAQVEAGQIRFVHNNTDTPPNYTLRVTDSKGGFAELALGASVDFTPINDVPDFQVNALTISEGQTLTLGRSNLLTQDEESGATALTYQVQSITNGQFELVSNGQVTTSFTQDDIDNGRIRFAHNGGEGAPTYTLVVTDGGGKTATKSMTIGTFTNVNDAPTFQNRSVTIAEGATVTLSLNNINATDPDHRSDQIRYSVTNVVGGSFLFNGAPLTTGQTFTAVDLSLGRLTFVDDGDSNPPTFDLVATDPLNASTTVPATITFVPENDAPKVTVNDFPITEGQPLTLTNFNLQATDEETTDPAQLRYRVTNVVGGSFILLSNQDEIFSFTQADINAGTQIAFIHDGTETEPSFTLEVADPNGGTSGPIAAKITYKPVNDRPVFSRNVLTIDEGAPVVLSTTNILVSDVDTPLSRLDFVIDSVANGFFSLNGTALAAGETFTRTQLVLGQVSFTATGNDFAPPSYTLTVRDNDLVTPLTATRAATVTFNPVNDAPEITLNNFLIEEGKDLILLTTVHLNARDEETKDTDRSKLVYTVSELDATEGVFFNTETLRNVTSFTQQDVDRNAIVFRHAGSDTPPTFTLTLSDPAGGTTTEAANVTFKNVNDPPRISVNSFSITEGGTLKLSATNLSATDPDNTPSELRYTVTGIGGGQFIRDTNLDGVPEASGVTTFTQQEVNDGVISFIHDGSETTPTFTFTLTDGTATTLAIPGNITFNRVNDPPESVVLSLVASTINEGSAITLNGTFRDVDSTSHTVTINWGNGTTTTIPASDIINNGNGTFSLPTINQVYSDDGTFTITATVNDGTATAQGTTTVTVNDVLPIVTLSGSGPVEAETLYTLTIAPPQDPGADRYVAFRINWGDGTTTTVNSPGDVGKVYKVFGDYTISVTAIDDAGREFGGFTQTANILYPITDFTGNGLTDFFWRRGSETALWILDSEGNREAGVLLEPRDSSFQVQAVADFNNDGKSDVFWRNANTGEVSIWLMDGTEVSDTIAFLNPGTAWRPVGFTDFNNDGSIDVLWRNLDGSNAIWLLNDGNRVKGLMLPSASTGFVAALTDANQDGLDDIVWRNARTGENSIWLMNGTTFSGQTINLPVGPTSWDLVGVADFNDDKIEDFVWRDISGQTAIWVMAPNGIYNRTVFFPSLDPAYELRGITDLNGDNQTDLLWRNSTTGDTFAWAMNGTTVTGTINYPDPPAGWQVYV